MVRVVFTQNLRRHLAAPVGTVEAASVAGALDRVFADNARLRGYILDEQGRLRRHVVLYRNGDKVPLDAPLAAGDELYVMQALSGG
jgi:molybdopterin converting factor small subunit